ncbi:hypothetical protein FF011L_29920 [Roseimaritima multifibrata]|uniref:Uncharacterized protein n=1 Tax=Roseimaritima multifibrata TaxID=1930274 RepID=A0A517MH49_9BACT|nr:hypothetical protein FF011L_29920 [Roseimaritima multifibrata]
MEGVSSPPSRLTALAHLVVHIARRQPGLGSDLNNHPVSIVFISKLNSLCRMTIEREMRAFSAIEKIAEGESVEFDVLPI